MLEKKRTNKMMMILGGMCLVSLMLTAPAVESQAGKRDNGVARTTLYWTDVWKENLNYKIADVVQYEGNSYLCRAEHTSSLSTIPSDDPDHWELLTASIYWAGEWDENLQYMPGDGVLFEGSSYLSRTAHVSSSSNIPPDAVYWELVASKGDTGDKGDTGVVGPQGPQGEQGIQGVVGLEGPQGMQGDKGDTGAVGPQGPQGEQGIQGVVGPEGPQGIKGDKGDTGAVGHQGPQGEQGIAGPKGPQGMKGNKGDTGAVGPQGPQGEQGIQGVAGLEGPQGIPGMSLWSDGGEGVIRTKDSVGIGAGVTVPGAALEIDGGIKIADDKDPCDLQKAGTLKWTGVQLMFCDGAQWTAVQLQGSSGSYGTISYQGLVWLDRNLGAQRVATDLHDASAFGDLYQWGRPADGHQMRTSGTTTELSFVDIPGHNKFITTQEMLWDWRQTPNSNLWSPDTGQNNPCPSGFRLPTLSEMQVLEQQDPNEVVEILHLASAGIRSGYDGEIYQMPDDNIETCFWTSTPGGMDNKSTMGYFVHGFVNGDNIQVYGDLFDVPRAEGCSVRCVQDN